MRKTKIVAISGISVLLVIFLVVLLGQDPTEELKVEQSSVSGGVFGPMLYVNNQMYYYHSDSRYHPPELDGNWSCAGTVQSQTSKWGERPTENFQANHDLVKTGSEIYHSKEGCIFFNLELGYDAEIFGDTIIVVSDGLYYQYIAEEASNIVVDRRNAFTQSACLIVDSVKYQRKMSVSGDGFKLDDSYVFLGEVEGVVVRTEQPTENFHTNIGAIGNGKVYMLPPDDESMYDILVLIRGDSRIYFSKDSD